MSNVGAGPPRDEAAGTPRILQVRTQILKKNDELARALRARFREAGVYVINVVSSPGAGKTTLLTEILRRLLARGVRAAAVVGDLATENDAHRLSTSGAVARQIVTGTVCHLEADMVERAIDGWDLAGIDVLFIENVGNLVCPASFDLGEECRWLLFPSTEGEDKPLKYPTLVNTADVVVMSKMDVAEAVGFDLALAERNVHAARPDAAIFLTSAKSGSGIDAVVDDLIARMRAARERRRPASTSDAAVASA